MTVITALTTNNVPAYFGRAVSGLSVAAEKALRTFYPYFITCTGLYHFGFGTSRISQGVHNETANKTASVAALNLSPSKKFLKIHGLFSTATGTCSLVEALHHFGVINLGAFTNLICTGGSLCFVYANITALEENIRIYKEVKKNEEKYPENHQQNTWLKNGAIFGILSNIGYILATTIVLLGAPTAIALVIGLISSFSSGLKILHDFKLWFENLPQ